MTADHPSNGPGGSSDADLTVREDALASPGRKIGPYSLLERIGAGGMGEVWRAEQTKPVRRTVALKLIKPGMDSREVIARFDAERQALALMDHPCIAKIFDAGTTPQGRPFFAMEYVQGTPINTYCDKRRLSIKQRLTLFQHVCEGVQHAHQKAVLHRDLKSSNVLVSDVDGKPSPKIIDFGLAKAMAHKLTDETMFTAVGQLVGTPEYMSPEQAELTGEAVDTRTDVYSLGVILYRLLAGVLPFDSDRLRRPGVESIRHVIREVDPAPPSARFSNQDKAAADRTSSRRRISARRLTRELQGDLDWIVMKALEKDRNRRYPSPLSLVADIGRHLNNQPVLASPPSVSYRARKFLRRHRIGVGVTAASMAFLLAFAVITKVQADRVAREAEHARQVSELLLGLFEDFDPLDRGANITLREILDVSAERTLRELSDQPLVQASLLTNLGSLYVNLELYEQARPLLEQAVVLRKQHLGPDHPDLGEALSNLAINEWSQGRYATSDSLFREALPIMERDLGRSHPDVTQTLHGLAVLCRYQARYAEAESLYEEVLDTRRRALGADHVMVAKTLSDMGTLYFYAGRLEDAEARALEALEIRERILPAAHASIGESYNNLGAALLRQGRFEEAEQSLLEALRIRQDAYGGEHTTVAQTLNNLGDLHRESGNYEQALLDYERSLSIYEAAVGHQHARVGQVLHGTALTHRDAGEWQEAMARAEEALRVREEVLGIDHMDVAETLALLASLHARTGNLSSAQALFDRALSIQLGPAGKPTSGWTRLAGEYATTLELLGNAAEADSIRHLLPSIEPQRH